MTSDAIISISNARLALDPSPRDSSVGPNGISLRTWFVEELSIARGTTVAVAGPSGSGKSTLLNVIAGIVRVIAGEVRVAEQSLNHLTNRQLDHFRGTAIGYLHQNLNLIDAVSAFENVAFAGRFAGLSLAESRSRATNWLNAVGLSHRMHALPSKMSQGERQRAALARALMRSPAIVLADEPTSNLDAHSADVILKLLFELPNLYNTTLVIVSHDDRVLQQCSRVVSADAWIATGK